MPERIEKTENNLIKIRSADFEMRPPVQNAKWNGEPEFKDALRIEIATGGETIRYEFVEKPKQPLVTISSEQLFEFTKIDNPDQKITINTSFIISIEEIVIVSRNYEIIGPTKNQHDGTVSLSYPAGTKSIKFSKDI